MTGLLVAIFVFAPLLRSGQPPIAQLILELLALALVVVLAWDLKPLRLRPAEAWLLLLLFLYPTLYLIPFPVSWADWLPGRELYMAAESYFPDASSPAVARLSILPFETEAAWLLLLVPIAVFIATRSLEPRQHERLVLVLLSLAACQAILGLMQYGAGAGPLYLGMEHARGQAVGTYTNRNHLAGLLEMVLPVTLALLLYSVGRRTPGERQAWRKRVAFLASLRGHAAVGYGALALLFLLAIVFTRSRAGIALTMLGVLLTIAAFARRLGGANVYGMAGSLVTATVGIGIVIGLAPVLDRFTVSGAIENARWPIFSATLTGIGSYLPLGSGPGTYPEVFPAYQPLELGRWLINHAHNDYLEWLFEGGALAAGLLLLALTLFLLQWRRLLTRGVWSRMRFVQVAAGIGVTLMLLHSFVDFNLHIPANILYFSFLAGVFLTEPTREESKARSRRTRRTPELGKEPDLDLGATATSSRFPAKPPPDQIRNPFLD